MLSWPQPTLTLAEINALRAQQASPLNNTEPLGRRASPALSWHSTESQSDTNSSFIRRIGRRSLPKDRKRLNIEISSPILLSSSSGRPLPSLPGQAADNTKAQDSSATSPASTASGSPKTLSPLRAPPTRPPRPKHGLDIRQISFRTLSNSSKRPDDSFWLDTAGPPRAKTLRLRTGSVVTVTSPKLDPWKKTIYLNGPILLRRPSMDTHNISSVNSYQEAMDLVYQSIIPGSDEAMADKICDFFDELLASSTYPAGSRDPKPNQAVGVIDRLATPPDLDVCFEAKLHDSLEVLSDTPRLGLQIASEKVSRIEDVRPGHKVTETSMECANAALTNESWSSYTGVQDNPIERKAREDLNGSSSRGIDEAPWIRSFSRDHNSNAASKLKRFSQ